MLQDVVRGRTSLELLEDMEELFPGGVVHRSKLPAEVRTVLAGAKGSRIWDVDGNEYIDYLLGSSAIVLGHGHPAVTRAVSDRMAAGSQFMQITDVALEHARKVLSAVPSADQIKFTGTGNEATYLALRLARAYTGKSKILKFEGAFHGTHDYTCWSTNPTEMLPFPQPEADTAGIPAAVGESVLVAPFNDADYTCNLIRQHKDDLAAVLIDPVMRMLGAKPSFLEELRRCTRECGVLLVVDEVVSGFRVAWGGSQEVYGIEADLTTLGKALGGGLPVGAIVGPKEIMSRADPAFKAQGQYAMISGTFSANPLSAAAGMAALNELDKPGTYDTLRRSGERLRDGLQRVCQKLEVPALVDSLGPTVDVKFTDRDDITDYRSNLDRDHDLEARVSVGLMKRGIFRLPGASFFISLAHTDEDLDQTVDVFETALREGRR